VRADVVERLGQRQASADEPAPGGDPGRGDEREPPDALRLLRSQLSGHEAAERVADQVDAAQLRRLEPAAEPAGKQARSQRRQVDQINEAPLGEPLRHGGPPAPRSRQTVHEHHGLTVAKDTAVGRACVDLELAELHPGSLSSGE
jgi:hypothetical protein